MGRFDEGADDPQAKRTDREGLYFPLCCHRCGGRVVVMEMERERDNVKRSINSSWKILAVIIRGTSCRTLFLLILISQQKNM